MSFVAPLFAGLGAAGGGLGTALTVGSGLIGTLGSLGQMRYQAQVAQNNAQIADQNAQRASDQAQQEQLQSDQQTAALLGEQEAIQAASGLNLERGSQLRTRRTAARLGRQDANRIREQGNYNIQNYQQQAENFRADAAATKAQMFPTALGGIASTFSSISPSLVGGSKSIRAPNRIGRVDPWAGMRRVTA